MTVPWSMTTMRSAVGPLFEVLGGEEDGDPFVAQVSHDVPQHGAAARVEARRGLVEEQHPRRRSSTPRGPGAGMPPEKGRGAAVGGIGEVEFVGGSAARAVAAAC